MGVVSCPVRIAQIRPLQMEDIKEGESVLVISSVLPEDIQNQLKHKKLKVTHLTPQQFTDGSDSNSSVFDIVLPHSFEHNGNLLSKIMKSLKSGGVIIITGPAKDFRNIEFELKMNGFVNIRMEGNKILATKPNYKIGSAAKLKLNFNSVKSVWKIDADSDEEVETIDPDNLLDDDDLKKPNPSDLRVCGTTGKRKACRDCSCGLAEELEAETKDVINTANLPKSSCGSCYLGDAFRCATCPYLGMPAFKPGEKIQLLDDFMKPDI